MDEFDALVEAADRRQWGHTEELLACNLELLSHLYRATLSSNGVKPHELPPPVHYPRPHEPPPPPAPAASRAEIRAKIPRKG